VHTPEGMPLPPNTLAELQRDMARLARISHSGVEFRVAKREGTGEPMKKVAVVG